MHADVTIVQYHDGSRIENGHLKRICSRFIARKSSRSLASAHACVEVQILASSVSESSIVLEV